MKTLIALFVVIFASSVHCTLEVSERRPAIPFPIPNRQCRPQHGQWKFHTLPISAYPQNQANVFYWGCKVWKPSYSSCTGSCPSSSRVTLINNRPRISSSCTCCRHAGIQLVRPYPYCLVIRIVNGRVSGRYEYVRQRLSGYRYALVSRCGCYTCGRRWPIASKEIDDAVEVEETEAVGYVRPHVSLEEESRGITEALGSLPGLAERLGSSISELPRPRDFDRRERDFDRRELDLE